MPKKTVFIIDNERNNIDKIKSKLNNTSFKVVGDSMEGDEALRKIKVIGHIDILIVNLEISGLDGLSVISASFNFERSSILLKKSISLLSNS